MRGRDPDPRRNLIQRVLEVALWLHLRWIPIPLPFSFLPRSPPGGGALAIPSGVGQLCASSSGLPLAPPNSCSELGHPGEVGTWLAFHTHTWQARAVQTVTVYAGFLPRAPPPGVKTVFALFCLLGQATGPDAPEARLKLASPLALKCPAPSSSLSPRIRPPRAPDLDRGGW